MNEGYTYERADGHSMCEFHIDDHDSLTSLANEMYPEFGGNTSVRVPPGAKPVIVFGQDESVFNQFSFNGMQ